MNYFIKILLLNVRKFLIKFQYSLIMAEKLYQLTFIIIIFHNRFQKVLHDLPIGNHKKYNFILFKVIQIIMKNMNNGLGICSS